jgi:hypothetical protein
MQRQRGDDVDSWPFFGSALFLFLSFFGSIAAARDREKSACGFLCEGIDPHVVLNYGSTW